jgi:hypothetical protein
VAPRYVTPRYIPRVFSRPYYVFRPRVTIGIGLWVGFPVTYPYPYGYYGTYSYPYGYPYPYPYPYSSYGSPYSPTPYPAYPASGSTVVVRPQAQASAGGLSFEVTPSDAEVYVDGTYVGTVGQFTPTTEPLDLTPGRHRIELRAPGYQTIVFDTDIVAGQVIPYRGAMQR